MQSTLEVAPGTIHMQRRPKKMSPEYADENWVLPPKSTAHDLVAHNAYDWELLPRMDSKWRKIRLRCLSCVDKKYMQYWPINWTTLAEHYEKNHNLSLSELRDRIAGGRPEDVRDTIPANSTMDETNQPDHSENFENSESVDHFDDIDSENLESIDESFARRAAPPPPPEIRSPKKRKVRNQGIDENSYMNALLAMVVSNNLSLSLVETDSFKKFVSFLREDAPPVNRQALKQKLARFLDD